jgi:hypothetical protein
MNDVEIYTNLPKSTLIKVYRHMLEEKKLLSPTHNNGYGINKSKGPCLRRPKIDGKIVAWRQFNRLPKAAVVVHIYMDGVNPDYLKAYLKEHLGFDITGEEE